MRPFLFLILQEPSCVYNALKSRCRAEKKHTGKIYPDSYRWMSIVCRTCNCAVSRWRSSTVFLNSATSLSAGSGCGENLFMISRTLRYGVSRQSSCSVIHMLYASKAGIERSIVVTLFLRSLWRPIRSHRRSSIPDVTFANGDSMALNI